MEHYYLLPLNYTMNRLRYPESVASVRKAINVTVVVDIVEKTSPEKS